VAPLQIKKSAQSPTTSSAAAARRSTLDRTRNSAVQIATNDEAIARQSYNSTQNSTQYTPPATPNGSQDRIHRTMEQPQPIFHNFLRAFYPFQPSNLASTTTVTLPLQTGDVILVHSIHTTGWADGTLLASGARGWLPTNYCEAYDEDAIRNLLKALLNFWDLVRGGWSSDINTAGSPEPWRGIIAGVRYLLENTGCLTRESLNVQTHDALRRHRKALLSELSSLVKTSKKVPDQMNARKNSEVTDELILKAFKIVIRGVHFLDIWNELVGSLIIQEEMLLEAGQSEDPLTPPSETNNAFTERNSHEQEIVANTSKRVSEYEDKRRSASISSRQGFRNSSANAMMASHRQSSRISYVRPGTAQSNRSITRPSSVHVHRLSTSHRISYTGHTVVHSSRLASEKLSRTHDIFLSYLGSFIGRLHHLQSRSAAELLLTTQQSVASGRDLLTVVEAVWDRDSQRAEPLERAKDAMYSRITELALAAREVVRPDSDEDTDGVMIPDDGAKLMNAATGCVKAAGECVAKTKFVIERIGDFELEMDTIGLGLGIGNALDDAAPNVTHDEDEEEDQEVPNTNVEEEEGSDEQDEDEDQGDDDEDKTTTMSHPRDESPSFSADQPDKPLPNIPRAPSALSEQTSSQDTVIDDRGEDSVRSSVRSLLPPLPHLSDPLIGQDDFGLTPIADQTQKQPYNKPFRADSIGVSSNSTHSTYLSSMRDSESSLVSHTSTRASTPEPASAVSTIGTPFLFSGEMPSFSSTTTTNSLANSQILLPEDIQETEAKVLEKTFEHELTFNKEGQITGGTLPALIERLTTHDSTPDSMFVSTFYLTFRLFTKPTEFAEALVDRFDYVGESPHIAGPVRLRVYNVFKGWMESHWRNDLDSDALTVIMPFANGKLGAVLPQAGKRLASLAEKVSSSNGPLVPRLVSSIGKTNTSIAPYITSETPLPNPAMNKSQAASLKNWRNGGLAPSIMDFDPLELARQFTIKESKIFCSILPEELLDTEWMKKSGSIAINVRAMSTLSTDMAVFVADTILAHGDAKKRATVIKQWVKVGKNCLDLNNYDSLMAILCSLDSSCIARLRRTWEVVSAKTKATLDTLRSVMEFDRNYAVLRQRLQGHVPPCLPFVGMYLTDLTFVNAGNMSTRQLPGSEGNGGEGISVINFDKHMKTAKVIGDLQRFQIPYRLTEVPELQDWIQSMIVQVRASELANVQACYRRSLILEPREANSSISGIGGSSSALSSMGFGHSRLPTVDEKGSTTPNLGTSGASTPITGSKFDFLSWGHKEKNAVPTSS
jgi:hypothetical protein